jgi:hypothetical protein
MSDDKKIIKFTGDRPDQIPENPVRIDDTLRPLCRHEQIMLEPHQRLVHCTQCAAVLDPFDFLLSNARTLQHAWRNHHAVQL